MGKVKKPPKILNRIVDKVLSYKSKPKPPKKLQERKMPNPKSRELTYTEQYFLSKYKKSNLIVAIKLAVKLIIIQAQSQNIYDIVKFLKITITRTSEITYHGLLCTNTKGFIMYLKNQLSEFDEKFTIAHEIGHTLFYENLRHQIGILSKNELSKEEYICNKFASLLLRELNI